MKIVNRKENVMRIKTPSIDAADLFVAGKCMDGDKEYTGLVPSGLSLKKEIKGKEVWNKYLFKNPLDDSMMVRHFEKILGDRNMKKSSLFKVNGLDSTNQIIHLTFKYTVKGEYETEYYVMEDVEEEHGVMVKGEDGKRHYLKDENGNRVKVTKTVRHRAKDENDNYITEKKISNGVIYGKGIRTGRYDKNGKEIIVEDGSRFGLRHKLYKEGFDIDGIHYVRWTRGGSSARVGKCLFINEELLKSMSKYSDCGIKLSGYGKNHDKPAEIDLASFEAYRSLLLSSIIGEIEIKPENILVIDDYESVFTDKVYITTKNEKDKLVTEKKETKIKNSIWDGQSLIDPSLMGEYAEHGMILLRNKMFKSCCFNCNIQQWFADNGMTDIKKLKRYGKTTAKKISDIKLITTPSSIKYMKFGDKKDWYKEWISEIENIFGVVKYDKPTKHDGGLSVLTHYQLINTLQLSDKDIDTLIKQSIKYIENLCGDYKAMQQYCHYYCKETEEENYKIATKMNILTTLLDLNPDFHNTAYYGRLAKSVREDLRNGIKKGKIFVNGNYSTLCGNPIEMLQATIGKFKGESQIGKGKIFTTRFDAGKTILACRSPHICMGNIYLPQNTVNEMITKYFNFSNEIVCINSIKENTLQKLSGCDFDSDTALLTDNEVLIKSAQKNSDKFLVPTSDVEAKKLNEAYTPENLANLDYRTSINLIGEIVNYSQILNSLYWNKLAEDNPDKDELEEIYKDICTLSVMSGVEIDKAKKDFGNLNQRVELKSIKDKYGITAKPDFFDYLSKKQKHRKENQEYMKYNTSMDKLYNAIKDIKLANVKTKDLPLKSIIKKVNYRTTDVNTDIADALFKACDERMKANYRMQNMTPEERLTANVHAYDILFEEVAKILKSTKKGLNKSTIRSIFDRLDKENSAIGDYMFSALLNCNCKKAIEILDKSKVA